MQTEFHVISNIRRSSGVLKLALVLAQNFDLIIAVEKRHILPDTHTQSEFMQLFFLEMATDGTPYFNCCKYEVSLPSSFKACIN